MSEVPFLDSCLGPDLTSLNEDDLLRYFLNDDFEQSPFDSKVPSSSPLLDPPAIALVSPLPKQSMLPITQPQPQHLIPPVHTPVQSPVQIQVKKETTHTVNSKAASAKAKPKSSGATTLPTVKASVPGTITPVSLPVVTPTTKPSLPSTVTTTKLPVKPTTVTTTVTTTTQQIHPITVNAASTILDHSILSKNSTVSPIGSPLSSPLSSPSPSPVPEDDKSMKRQRRLLKNRESAQLSRIRKKMYIDELERKVNALVSENSGLREEVVHLNDVLKQVAGAEGEIMVPAKGALTRTDIMHAISGTNSGANNHNQAKKYAGVCLLVVLFSLGLFLNVATPNNSVQHTERFVELDHSNKNNSNSSNANNNNNDVHFRNYGLPSAESGTVIPVERKEKSTKRSWEEDNVEHFPVLSKRTRTEYSQDLHENMIIESGMDSDEDSLFDVLEDDAFLDDGVLSTSSSLSLPLSSPASPAVTVPATPPLPAGASMPSTPIQPPSPVNNTDTNTQLGVAVMMPSLQEMSSSELSGVMHIHIWSLLRNTNL